MKLKHENIFMRILFSLAMLLLFIAFLDWILRLFGWSFSWVPYQPGRLLELSSFFMIFVIAVLLKQIRDGSKKTSEG